MSVRARLRVEIHAAGGLLHTARLWLTIANRHPLPITVMSAGIDRRIPRLTIDPDGGPVDIHSHQIAAHTTEQAKIHIGHRLQRIFGDTVPVQAIRLMLLIDQPSADGLLDRARHALNGPATWTNWCRTPNLSLDHRTWADDLQVPQPTHWFRIG